MDADQTRPNELAPDPSQNGDRQLPRKARPPMVQAELLGSHVHPTSCGTTVTIWRRGDRFLARGRFQRRQFGKTLEGDVIQAGAALCRLLVSLDNGSFERPTEARQRPLKVGLPPRLVVRELSCRFVADTRRLHGKKTAQSYRTRLVPLIEFAERPEACRRWPMAVDVDREFAIEFRSSLFSRMVTRNGHSASAETRMSPGQIYNVLDCSRSLFNWARRPDVNQLPSTFANPFSKEIVGERPRKDPVRPIPIPLETRIALVGLMDTWQLCQMVLSLVLPLRPEDFSGLLISEVDFHERKLRFNTRLGGRDFNKGRQAFAVPFPAALTPVLLRCIGRRVEGPLLRRRAVWDGRSSPQVGVNSHDDIRAHFERELQRVPAGDVQAAQDTKRLFRRLIQRMGGVSNDSLTKEFKSLLARLPTPLAGSVRFYDLKGSCNSDLERSGVSLLVQRYVTGHACNDIINEYASLDPVGEMPKYFQRIEPLLTAIERRSLELGLVDGVAT